MKRLPGINFNQKSLEFNKREFIKFSIDYLLEKSVYVEFEKDDINDIDYGTISSLNNINYYIFMFNFTDEKIMFKDLMKKYKEK